MCYQILRALGESRGDAPLNEVGLSVFSHPLTLGSAVKLALANEILAAMTQSWLLQWGLLLVLPPLL